MFFVTKIFYANKIYHYQKVKRNGPFPGKKAFPILFLTRFYTFEGEKPIFQTDKQTRNEMKKMFFSMAAMAALCLITACGDETSADPTRAELCQGGLSFDCLADGTWQMDGATEVTEIGGDTLRTIYKDHNFGATPAKLTFKGDGSFTFTYPPQSAMLASCRENTTTGTWSVSGKTLSIKTRTGNTCFAVRNYSGAASIRNEGGQIELDLNGIFFLNSEMENSGDEEKATTTEVFHISAQ